ncbi:hypothetical protein Zmor_003245 [Zophobas morio]|uniref:CIDE-N domain-containing protein n=1 Tax=Zophobas morio TaxID=2755281 RepID=A0AA38HNX3_9CUCU|nr:hypothetical protein Zmor_003245 [Zophobas morio]
MLAFKIWNVSRTKKVFVAIEEDEQMLLVLVAKASEKLQIDGSTLVLETDGTVIDDETVLKMVEKEVLILLTKEECWVSADVALASASFISQASTVTISSSSSSSHELSPFETEENKTWVDFEIPWQCLPKSVIRECEEGFKTGDCRSKVINMIVDNVREFTKHAEIDKFRAVAKQIVAKYPKQFADVDDDGIVIGDGNHTILKRLVDRNNYLNRPHKRSPNATYVTDIPLGKRRKMLSKKAGCSNWQPEIETKSPESLEEKKNTLNALHNAFLNNVTLDLETTTLLNETYNMQRLFLNKCDAPTIEEIVTEWPVLLTTPVTFWHFEKLTSKNINVLEEQFTHKAPKILQLGQQNKIKVTCENSYLQCLEVIAKYFNEDLKILVDEQDKRNQTVTCNEPCIRSNQEDDENRYFIYIEKKKVAESTDFITAFKLVFSFYYNLNMCYPKQISHTLQFVQMYFFKMYPEIGTKSKKKTITKVVSLMNKLKNI